MSSLGTTSTKEKWKAVGGVVTLAFIGVAVLVYYFGPGSVRSEPREPSVSSSSSSGGGYGWYEDRWGNFHEYYPDDESSDFAGARPFKNCDEARSHGADPVHEGDPGFGPHLDRDGDGVGCEPWYGN